MVGIAGGFELLNIEHMPYIVHIFKDGFALCGGVILTATVVGKRKNLIIRFDFMFFDVMVDIIGSTLL